MVWMISNEIYNQKIGQSLPYGLIKIINEMFGVDDLGHKRHDERQ